MTEPITATTSPSPLYTYNLTFLPDAGMATATVLAAAVRHDAENFTSFLEFLDPDGLVVYRVASAAVLSISTTPAETTP